MAVLESCPKHNMVAYLEKTDGNAEFHEIIDFLARSSIHNALTVSPVVSTTFVEQFWMSAKSKIINNVRYITAKVAGKPVSISEASIRSDLLFDDADGIDSLPNQAIFDAIQLMGYEGDLTSFIRPSPPHLSEVHVEPQSDPSPRPSPTTHILDSIPESSGGNHRGQSSSDKSLLGNEGDMTLQSVYELCISLYTQSLDEECLHEAKIGRKEILKDTVDAKGVYTENDQDVGKIRNVLYKEKESAEDAVSIEDVVSADKEKVSTDRSKESTDKEKDSTGKEKDSTDKEQDSTDRPDEGTKGRSATPTTPTPTPTTFKDDETITQVLLNMSQAKAVLREKEKGVELKDVEKTERPRPTSTRSLLTLKPLPKIDPKDKGKKKIKEEDESNTESKGIPEAEKKFKQLARDEEMARKINERAKFLHDTIATQRRFLAEQRVVAIKNIPPTRTQLRNQMMTYLKHVGNKKHSDLKNKTFEEIQALYEKVKRFDESFTAVGSTKDERKIKEMNEGAKDLEQKRLKKKVAKETPKKEDTAKVPAKVDVTEQGTKKRKGGHIKMIARKRKRPQSDVDSNDEHRECLKIVTFEGTIDSDIMEKKSFIARMNKVSSPDGDYLVIYRANGNFRAVIYSEITLEGIELILWGDLKIMMESSTEENDQSDFWNDQQDWEIVTWRLYEACGVYILELKDGTVIHMLVERRDVFGDAIHTDFFSFFAGPYYTTYPEDGVVGNYEFTREEWDAPYRPTFGVLMKEVFKDHAVCKTIVDQFPTPVSAVKKQVSGLIDKLSSSDASFSKSKDKGKEKKKKIKSLGKSLDNLHVEGLFQKFLASDEFSRVQGELLSLAASFRFERGLSMHQTKDEFVDLLKKMISEYVVEPLLVILQLQPEKLVRPANVPIPRDTRVSPPIAKESTVTPVSKSLELSANVVPASSAIALEQNEEQVSAAVDGSDLEMTDGAAHSKSGGVFVQGTSHVLDDVAEVTVVGSERVSSGLTDVVVALSAGEKGDGSTPSSTVKEGRGAWYAREHLLLRAWGKLTVDVLLSIQRILMLLDICYDYKSIQLLPLASWLQFGFAPGALLVALPFLLLLVSSIDGLVLIPTDTSWLRNSSFIVASPVNTSAFRFKIFGRCVIRNLWNGTVASIISSLYLLSCSVAEAASPANSASQSMAWLDALNFNWMAYEYILRYSTSITKTKAATYEIKWIEDLVRNLWSPVKVTYDKHGYLGTSHWVTRLTIMKKYDYGHLGMIEVRREDQQLYIFRKGDFPLLRLQDIEDMNVSYLLKKGLPVQEEAMETSKKRRNMLGYRIQQLSKGSSEGSGIILEVLDELKDNSGSSSSSLSGSDDEVQDVSSDEENKAVKNKADVEVTNKQARDEHPV
ncbi:hypothetical protein Tco_1193333 [Tanacetum coccineum]